MLDKVKLSCYACQSVVADLSLYHTMSYQVEKFCKDQVEKALLLAESEWNGVQPKEPLIRLRINRAFKDGEGAFEAFNLFRFGEQFRGK